MFKMKNKKGWKRTAVAALAIFLGVMAAGIVYAATTTLNAYTGVATFVYDDSGVGNTKLPITSVVQLIQASGATPNPPDPSGNPTGGDTVLKTGAVTGLAGAFYISQGLTSGTVYCRAWNAATINGATHYGDSATKVISESPTPAIVNWEVPNFATTTPKPVLSAGTVQFSSATYSVSEAGPTVTITVTRVGGSSGAASVNYATSNGTATAGSDYTAASGTLNWSNGDSASKTFNVSITEDGNIEGNETVNLTLSNAVGATLGSPNTATLTINDNDNALNITTTSLPNGTVGVAYNQPVNVTGGTSPYTWSIISGSLPSGLGLNANTGDITGTPVSAGISNFTVQVQDSVMATDTQALSITINDAGSPTITGSSPDDPYVGETITITGSGFGDSPGTITIGGVEATPTSWEDGEIVVAVPDGVAPGSADVVVDGSAPYSITINSGGLVIDDFEGGCVGDWVATPASGYYAYGSGTTPTAANFANEVRQAEALKHGSFGAKVMYSYDGVETYGGWGAARVGTIDVDSYASFSFYINWDGSANDIKLGFEDSAGHVYFATVSNATLQLLGGYNKVTVNKSAFSEDIDNPGRTPGAIDWTDILKYSFTYTTQGTSSNYQYIDSISAGDVDWGGGINGGGTGEVVITDVDPPAGPAGTKFTITGSGFGSSQGQSAVVFENLSTKVNYTVDIISWSDTKIEAYVPKLAPAGNYTLKVVRITISAGNVSAYESNPKTFQVTASLPPGGIATIFPNPFNPLATSLSASGFKVNEVTIAFSASGASNIGIYIYDATARLVYHETTTDTQVAWDGKDTEGNYVADGIYLLRIVNEDSKSLLAKNKILVIKK